MAELRDGTRDDLEDVLALWARSGSPPSVSDRVESLAAVLDHDPHALLLAFLDGALVGSLIAVWNGWRGSFYRLAVDPAHRRRGIATALVREGEDRLRARGALRLDALVASNELTATSFWRGVGFELQVERARFIRNVTSSSRP